MISERKSIITLTYIIIVLMAYFGPNAEIIGNINLAIWQYQRPIEDIKLFVWNVSLFLLVDICSFIMNSLLLWCFCQIDLIKVLMKLQKEFWPAFTITEAFIFMEVNKDFKNHLLIRSLTFFHIIDHLQFMYWIWI